MRNLRQVVTGVITAGVLPVVVACTILPEQPTTALEDTGARSCNREAVTGTHLPRCDDGVAGVTRAGPPMEPGPVVFPQKSRAPGSGV